jgi:excisionase family DNA binding protein
MAISLSFAEDDLLLNEVQAAKFLGLSSRTLQAWRSQGRGPAYVKVGRSIRYWRSALLEWMSANTCCPTD